tara:strand:- start:131 stop:1084 length:954 start_codon:yes stop_codon:yes gene_type:complete
MKYNYSLIILNWKRPKNVIEIVQKVYDYPYIDEIIISNGHPNTILTFTELSKIRSFDDTINNKYYGLDLRFLRGVSAKNNKLIIMDDDIVIDHSNLTKLLTHYEKNPNKLVGIEGRNMEHDYHYGKVGWKSVECDIVLTRLVVCDKVLCELFFRCKPIIEHVYKQGVPYGNGEDIFLSFIAKLFYKVEKHTLVIGLNIKELPNNNSIHMTTTHIPYRKHLCEYLKLNRELLRNVIHNQNSYLTIQQKPEPPKIVSPTIIQQKTKPSKIISRTFRQAYTKHPVHYNTSIKKKEPSSNVNAQTDVKYIKVGNKYIIRKK